MVISGEKSIEGATLWTSRVEEDDSTAPTQELTKSDIAEVVTAAAEKIRKELEERVRPYQTRVSPKARARRIR